MNYRPFARTGVKVSPLCLGVMNFGGRGADEDSERIFDMALAAGINFFDTANVYSDGASERMLGRLVAERQVPRQGGHSHEGALSHGRRPQRPREQPAAPAEGVRCVSQAAWH